MYCPNCGAETTAGVNYCKHCGGILSEPSVSPNCGESRNVLTALILAMSTMGLVLGGLSIVFKNAMMLVGPQPGFVSPAREVTTIAAMMVFFGSAAVIVSTLLLIKLFAKVMGFDSRSNKETRQKNLQPGLRPQRLSSPPSAMLTVTEHTTRNFEPVFQRDTGQ
jgi:hypothetical protein